MQSASAASSPSKRATRASTSCVWWAIPSTRYASYSRGLTRRRSKNPKFLRARTTWAMLTSSCGSWSTTTTLMGSSHQLQYPEALRFLPVPSQPDPPVAAAPHELTAAPLPAREHFVDQEVEPQVPSYVD